MAKGIPQPTKGIPLELAEKLTGPLGVPDDQESQVSLLASIAGMPRGIGQADMLCLTDMGIGHPPKKACERNYPNYTQEQYEHVRYLSRKYANFIISLQDYTHLVVSKMFDAMLYEIGRMGLLAAQRVDLPPKCTPGTLTSIGNAAANVNKASQDSLERAKAGFTPSTAGAQPIPAHDAPSSEDMARALSA